MSFINFKLSLPRWVGFFFLLKVQEISMIDILLLQSKKLIKNCKKQKRFQNSKAVQQTVL